MPPSDATATTTTSSVDAVVVDTSLMSPADRKRHERNLREQQRSNRINQQIKELQDVLEESNVPFKPNKYSVLVSVTEYVKQLQAKAIVLDEEQHKLVSTIQKTNEMMNSTTSSQGIHDDTLVSTTNDMIRSSSSEINHSSPDIVSSNGDNDDSTSIADASSLIDYSSLFRQCPIALGIAALDGRILESNVQLELLLQTSQDEMKRQSLFSLVRNHQDIYKAMATMLESAGEMDMASSSASSNVNHGHWSGPVISIHNKQLYIYITLTVANDGNPKFFSCALTAPPST